MQLHQLQSGVRKKAARRIGRGGKRGKTSGKGGKGQTARAGNRPRPEMRDIIKRIPKLRGHGKNRARTVYADRPVPVVVNLSAIESVFASGDTVSPATLIAKKVITLMKGKAPKVKILASGDLTKKLTVSGCTFSASAKEKVEKAGGSVI